jgi:hypothetical protein
VKNKRKKGKKEKRKKRKKEKSWTGEKSSVAGKNMEQDRVEHGRGKWHGI